MASERFGSKPPVRLAILQFSGARDGELRDLCRGLPAAIESRLAGPRVQVRTVLLKLRGAAAGGRSLAIESPVTAELVRAVTSNLEAEYALTGHVIEGGGRIAIEVSLLALPDSLPVYSKRFEGRREELPDRLSALVPDLFDVLKAEPDPAGPAASDLGTADFEALLAYCAALVADPGSAERRDALERAHRIDPAFPDPAIGLARELLRDKRTAEASALLERSEASGHADPRVARLRGLLFEMMGDPQGALDVYRRLKAARPDSDAVDFHIGCALNALRRHGEAEAHLARFAERHPDRPEAHENLGLARMGRMDVAAAIDAFKRGLEARPESPSLHANLGSALAEKGDAAEAREVFERGIAFAPKHWPLYYNFALFLSPLDPDRAIEMYRRVVELEPHHAAALNNLGALLVRRLEYDRARECWESALASDPKGKAGQLARDNIEKLARPEFREENEASVLSALYTEAKARNEIPAAVRRLREITARRADSWYAWFLLGMAQRESGDLPEALAAYAKALELKPEQPDALTEMGVIQGQLGRLDASLESSRRAAAVTPDSAAIVCNLGVAYLRMGRYDEAEAEFARAKSLAPDDPVIDNCFEALKLTRAGKKLRFI